jgi:hypothetical protein
MTKRLFAAAAAALPCIAALAASPVEFLFEGGQCFHHRAQLAPGATLEVCGPLPTGEQVAWKFDAAGPVDFSLRPQGAGAAAERREGSRGTRGLFVTPEARRYCFSFRNAARVEVALAMELEHP